MANEESFANRMLVKIESVLEGKAENDVLEYEIAGRQLKKYSFSELMSLRAKLKREIKEEQQLEDLKNGLGNRNRKVLTRFK